MSNNLFALTGTRHDAFTLALVALVVLSRVPLAFAQNPQANPLDSTTLNKAITRAIAYFEQAQADDGSFSASSTSGPGVTARVTHATNRNHPNHRDPDASQPATHPRPAATNPAASAVPTLPSNKPPSLRTTWPSFVANADASTRAAALASGISEAMNCTAFGLMAALIALMGFAALNGKTQGLIDDINSATVQVMNLVVNNRSKVNLQGVQQAA